jgi:hypothetical protein
MKIGSPPTVSAWQAESKQIAAREQVRMGIEIQEWPPGAIEPATLIARSSLEATGGDRDAARTQLVTLIATFVMPGAPAKDIDALADQVLAQPELAALITDQVVPLEDPHQASPPPSNPDQPTSVNGGAPRRTHAGRSDPAQQSE